MAAAAVIPPQKDLAAQLGKRVEVEDLTLSVRQPEILYSPPHVVNVGEGLGVQSWKIPFDS